MSKKDYIYGFVKHFNNVRISKLAIIDSVSRIHSKARICRNVKLFSSHVGAYTYIAPGSEFTHVNVGKFCSIGRQCLVGLPNHSLNYLSTSPIFTSKKNALRISWTRQNSFQEFKSVNIGNDVWIGSRAIIMGGVCIGDGAVIGAGAIVTKDIPNYAIAVGIPAKVINFRFDKEIIRKLDEIKWWNLPEDFLQSNINIFNKADLTLLNLELFTNKEK